MPPAKDVVMQARVTAGQYQLVEAAAIEQGVSVAAFVRTAVLQHATAPLFRAWVTRYGEMPATILGQDRMPHYMLRRIAAGMSGEHTFAMFVLGQHGLVPVSRSAITYEMDFLRQPALHQVVLDGSQRPWFVVQTTFNSGTGLVEIVLRPEGTAADVIRRRILDAKDGLLIYDLIGGGQLCGRVEGRDIGVDSFELRVESAPRRTVPYASVVAVSSP